jgi:ParB-like chromosome segregation protein Spo0J
MGQDFVDALLLPCGETVGLLLDHQRHNPRSALEEAWLVKELLENHGLGPEEVARRLGRKTRWVARRRSLLDVLPEALQPFLRDGRIPPDAAMRYLVPLARHSSKQMEILVANFGRGRWSVRDIGRVYEAWKRAKDAAAKICVLERPRIYARVLEEEERPDPPLPDEKKKRSSLRKDLQILGSISRRARASLASVQPGDSPLDEALRRAEHHLRIFLDEIAAHLTGCDTGEPELPGLAEAESA